MRNFDRNNLGNNKIVVLLMVTMIMLVMLFVSSKQGDAAVATGGSGAPKHKKNVTKKVPDKGAFLIQFKNSTGETDAELTDFFNISRVTRHNQKTLRNISFVKYFSGTWDAPRPATAPANTSKKSPSLGFVSGNHGEFYVGELKLIRHRGKAVLESDTIVDGVVMVRDGTHSTDYTVEYTARGTYFWKLGTLLLLGCTTRAAPNMTFVAPSDSNSSWFVRRFMSDSSELFNTRLSKSNPNITLKSVCPLRAALKVSSLVDDKEVKDIIKRAQKASRGERKRDSLLGSNMVIIDGSIKHTGTGLFKVQGGVHNMHSTYLKVSYFVVFFVLLGISEYVLTLRQIRSTSSLAALSRISPKAIGVQCTLDVYISIFMFITAASFCKLIANSLYFF